MKLSTQVVVQSIILKYNQINKLKDCFSFLNGDGTGSIGIEEHEEPLIGLGLKDIFKIFVIVCTVFAGDGDEVQWVIGLVGGCGSSMIEFPEFLDIIKNSDGNEKTSKINKFFKDMTNGTHSQMICLSTC